MYETMKDKPRTFLQLLWRYETEVARNNLSIAQTN